MIPNNSNIPSRVFLSSVLQSLMKKKLLLLLFVAGILSKQLLSSQNYPNIYAQLGTPLFDQADRFMALNRDLALPLHEHIINDYLKKVDIAIEHGEYIDTQHPRDTQRIKSYLKELRELQKLHDNIEKSYKRHLYRSINDDNKSTFLTLIDTPLPFLSRDTRLKEKLVHYYKKAKKESKLSSFKPDHITYLETLSRDFELDQNSYNYIHAMFKTSQKHQVVQERKVLNDFLPNPRSSLPVQVISIRTKTGFDLYLENHAYYDVSITLNATKLLNLSSSEALPFVGSFPAQSRTKVLHFSIKNPQQKSMFQTRYSTTMGRLNPRYDKDYLYALPYARGKAYKLTQGFNGKHTHKGSSAYALDFHMDKGTRVHAMREGTVVSFEDKQTEHGFSPEFANKSNYIIIQHSDGTMAMYGHLKPRGVRVKLGQKVYKHSFIGLSGNTGYSSGPHLHVHISAIKSLQSGSGSVPFRFLAKRGKIDSPSEKTFYIAK